MRKKTFKLIFSALILVFIIYNIISLIKSPSPSYTAKLSTVEISYDFDGIIVRDEKVVTFEQKDNSIIVPDVKEGEMVKKGRLVATYFDSDITSEDKAKLSEINSKINKLSSSVSDENVNSASSVDSEIQKDISSLKEAFSYRDMQKVKQIKQSIVQNLSYKKEDGTTLSKEELMQNLLNEKRQIESSFKGTKTDIYSPKHGVFKTSLDSFEYLNEKALTSITVSGYDDIINKAKDAKKDKNAIFKIVDNARWSVCIKMKEKESENFSVGENVIMSFGADKKDLNATVEYISPVSNSNAVVVFSSNDFSDFSMENRFVKVNIIKKRYTGLEVKVDSIRVKNGKSGVYVKTENTVKFREIDVIYKEKDKVLAAYDNTKSNALLLYDEIILN